MKKEVKRLPKRLEKSQPGERQMQLEMVNTMNYPRKRQQLMRQFATAQITEDEDYFFEVEDN